MIFHESVTYQLFTYRNVGPRPIAAVLLHFAVPQIPKPFFPFGVLSRSRFFSIFFPTQPAPDKTGVIPAVLPVKGLR